MYQSIHQIEAQLNAGLFVGKYEQHDVVLLESAGLFYHWSEQVGPMSGAPLPNSNHCFAMLGGGIHYLHYYVQDIGGAYPRTV